MASTRRQAEALDACDPLASWRDHFCIPRNADGIEEVYLLGNSLGLQPRRAADYVKLELEKWQNQAARAHVDGEFPWVPYHEFLCEPMARLVGANPNEVVVMNSLTVNLHLMLATFYRPLRSRRKILLEQHAFPSDRYAVATHLQLHGVEPEQNMILAPPDEGELFSTDSICDRIRSARDDLALVLLPGVQYYTGQRLDIPKITACAHELEIPIGWDLAHAVGNVELTLHDWNVDFAVWCSYKYLNSGPGAPGGCFIHARHATNTNLNRLAGWWGYDKATRFLMENEFRPIPTAEGWQLSNPPILAMAAVRGSLDVFTEAGGMAPLVAKSRRLTSYLEGFLLDHLGKAVTIVTPRDEGESRLPIVNQAAHRCQWQRNPSCLGAECGDERLPRTQRRPRGSCATV